MTSKAIALIALAAGVLAAAPPPQAQSVRPAVIVKASDYVESYEARLGGLVAEENYSQHVLRDGQRAPAGQKRKLKSDFMLVKFGADEPFTPYRDVLEVD